MMWPVLAHIVLNHSARYSVLPEYNSVNGLSLGLHSNTTFSIIIDDVIIGGPYNLAEIVKITFLIYSLRSNVLL